ncbi:hypothetical protein [Candidatus Symbiopectobacterium sp. 'North America']|uniref:hypothetical protein n=1 Tax=Candidatus Symbiopectobacterium sp. 'North America' TaxID=2794574 RepID=UPI001FD46621|nr:hypothetical protein [Candidatus Symbiopectobacterium sp. 'North America']
MTVRFHLDNLLLERTKAAEETLTDSINEAQTADLPESEPFRRTAGNAGPGYEHHEPL